MVICNVDLRLNFVKGKRFPQYVKWMFQKAYEMIIVAGLVLYDSIHQKIYIYIYKHKHTTLYTFSACPICYQYCKACKMPTKDFNVSIVCSYESFEIKVSSANFRLVNQEDANLSSCGYDGGSCGDVDCDTVCSYWKSFGCFTVCSLAATGTYEWVLSAFQDHVLCSTTTTTVLYMQIIIL